MKDSILEKIKENLPFKIGPYLKTRDSDIFFVSYPKSGNTWLRFLIANMVYPRRKIDFISIEKMVPDIYINTAMNLAKLLSPRYLKSHEPFNPKYKKVIYLVRDPRSVAVSYYHHRMKTGKLKKNTSISSFIETFLSSNSQYGTWQENVGSWLGAREGSKNFYYLKYEDLRLDTKGEVKKICDFLKLKKKDGEIEDAVKKSSFSQMRDLEKKNRHNVSYFKSTRKDIKFIRKGSVDEWKVVLSKWDIRKVNKNFGRLMKKFDYL